MKPINRANKQRGATLVVALVILLILTLTAVTAMRTTTLEEKMVSNARDYNVAFESAEIALRTAENWLATLTGKPIVSNSGSNGVWTLGVPPTPDPANLTWWSADADTDGLTNGVPVNGVQGLPNPISNISVSETATQPQFYIEELSVDRTGESLVKGFGAGSVKVYHQVTGLGRGTTNSSLAMVQSTFVRRYQ